MNAPQALVIVSRPCTRCGHDLIDPASIQAGIGPVCRGLANKILAKEIPSAWSADLMAGLFFLTPEVFPEEARARFTAVFEKVMLSKGMNQTEPAKGEDWRETVKELVYLASQATTNAIYEALIGGIKGLGYKQYAAFVSGESASGEASLSYEQGRLHLKGVRNPIGQSVIAKMGATWDKTSERWSIGAELAHEFIQAALVYWPFVKGASVALADALSFWSLTSCPAGQILFLRFADNEAFVEAFLGAVPWYDRHLDTKEGAWRVRDHHRSKLEQLLAAHL